MKPELLRRLAAIETKIKAGNVAAEWRYLALETVPDDAQRREIIAGIRAGTLLHFKSYREAVEGKHAVRLMLFVGAEDAFAVNLIAKGWFYDESGELEFDAECLQPLAPPKKEEKK